ncbi:MAG: hypothetical protein QXJ20_02335 [Candidatus Aenigmatarchaeota archaeon]
MKSIANKNFKGEEFDGKMKGQWYIISAIIVAGALIVISNIFRSYDYDYSYIIRMQEDFLFRNVEQELEKTILYSRSYEELEYNIKHFIMFSQRRFAELGYSLRIINETSLVLPPGKTRFRIELISERVNITKVVEVPASLYSSTSTIVGITTSTTSTSTSTTTISTSTSTTSTSTTITTTSTTTSTSTSTTSTSTTITTTSTTTSTSTITTTSTTSTTTTTSVPI